MTAPRDVYKTGLGSFLAASRPALTPPRDAEVCVEFGDLVGVMAKGDVAKIPIVVPPPVGLTGARGPTGDMARS